MVNKPTLNELVFAALKKIPRGRIVTYKILAHAIGRPRAARAVANAVGRNKQAPRVPCHRVIRSDGQIGGYSGCGGATAKMRLLKNEGVAVRRSRVENLQKFLYNFKAK